MPNISSNPSPRIAERPSTGQTGPLVRPQTTTQSQPVGNIASAMARAKASQAATQATGQLTSPQTRQSLTAQVSTQTSGQIQSRASRIESAIGQTSLGREVQSQVSSIKGIRSEAGQIGSDLRKVTSGPSIESARAGGRLVSRAGNYCGHPEVAQATGKILQPLATIESGQKAMDSCRKAWDQPSVENISQAGADTAQLLKDAQTTLNMIPGGEMVTGQVGKLLGGLAPGVGAAMLAPKIAAYVEKCKATYADPSAKNIADLTLESAKLAAAITTATGIPVVSQISAVAEIGIELTQKLLHVDYGQVAKDVGNTVSGWFWSACGAVGIA